MPQNTELDNKPFGQWSVAELREELRKRNLATKGLKVELVKRLDEAVLIEKDSDNTVELGNGVGFNDVLKSSVKEDVEPEGEYNAPTLSDKNIKTVEDVIMAENTDLIVNVSQEIKDINGNAEVFVIAIKDTVKEASTDDSEDSGQGEHNVLILSGARAEDVELIEKLEDSNEDSSDRLSEQCNQVFEVSQDLGLQVKYDSISSDSVSINQKNNVKDNMNVDDFPLELEVIKQEAVQVVDEQADGTERSTDAEEADSILPFKRERINNNSSYSEADSILPFKRERINNNSSYSDQVVVQNPMPVQQSLTEGHATLDVDSQIVVDHHKEDNADAGSPEKLNLDRSSDESMEEDLLECRSLEADIKSLGPANKVEDDKVGDALQQKHMVGMSDKISHEIKDIAMDDIKFTATTEKRKAEEKIAGNNDAPKRQRRWSVDTINVPSIPEPKNLQVSILTPKITVQPELRRNFSSSNSTSCGESFKERLVPTPKNPATTSLRIDNFVRPFTLKAVQELLAKNGKVCDFWMDHIKTHCYVTYSSAEEATETRNAVYNQQWPPNGGRHLIAEFVDPQEVKIRSEAPPQSPLTPVAPSLATPKAPTPMQTQAPALHRPQILRQLPLLPPPPPPLAQPPPPTPLSNPPPVAVERLPPPPVAAERLPPPPPKKSEPAVLTLDDLFRKTKTTPRIYYVPLSEEQVKAKLAAQGKSTQLH